MERRYIKARVRVVEIMVSIPKLIFVSLLAACMPALAQSASDLMWPQHPKLTWDDFKGEPPEHVAFPSALSDTGFKFQLMCHNGMLDVDAHAFFTPTGSWVKPDEKTAELLKHEQGHFDMAEEYALRLRKAIREGRTSCEDRARANAAGQRMVVEFQKDWEDAERQYEQDTRDGTDLARQDAASSRIAADLAALRADQP